MAILFHIFLCLLTLTSLLYCIESNSRVGFSTYLIHRTSPLASHNNSSNTNYYDDLNNSLQRALQRAMAISSRGVSSLVQAPLTAIPGEYNMKVSLGTPPQDFKLVADTGSDLSWTLCKPCISCYKQDVPNLFDPKKSSTYRKQSCNSVACKDRVLSYKTSCEKETDTCQYEVAYEDNSKSSGTLSSESLTFQSTSGSPVVIPNIVFGCGSKTVGKFPSASDGLVGLGNGKYSFVNQFSEKTFSYCLVPLRSKVTSIINFGATGVVSGPGVKTTPFYKQNPDTYYYLNLQSVSVNGKNFKIGTKQGADEGNMVIDSGTPATFIQREIYNEIQHAFKESISATPEPTPNYLCYKKGDLKLQEVPTVIFHFKGADIELGALNTMTEFAGGKMCLSMLPTSSVKIFGNLQQMDFLIGYDLVKKTVSFKKVDCSNHVMN